MAAEIELPSIDRSLGGAFGVGYCFLATASDAAVVFVGEGAVPDPAYTVKEGDEGRRHVGSQHLRWLQRSKNITIAKNRQSNTQTPRSQSSLCRKILIL